MLVQAIFASVVVVVGDVLAVDALLPAGLACVISVFVVVLVLALDVLCCIFDLHLLSSDTFIREPLLAAPAFGPQTSQAVNSPTEKSHATNHQQDSLHLSPVAHS